MKLLTGFKPLALLTDRRVYRPESPRDRLLNAIDSLESKGLLTDYNSRLLEAIILSPMWSEDLYRAVEDLGITIANDIFRHASINCDYDDMKSDPDNPENWAR